MAPKAHGLASKSIVEANQAKKISQGDSNFGDNDSSSDEDHDAKTETLSSKQGGMADAMAKILGKRIPKHKSAILSKGRSDKEIRKRKLERKKKEEIQIDDAEKTHEETDDLEKKIDKEVTSSEKKKLWEELGRIKPDPLDRVNERKLQKIATRGVVQLFNAVRQQQKLLEEKLSEATSERRKEKVVESMTKRKFIDLLKGANVSMEDVPAKQVKKNKNTEAEQLGSEKDKSTWSILRDDFMMGATMKDWDKQVSEDEECVSPEDDIESSDSGE